MVALLISRIELWTHLNAFIETDEDCYTGEILG